jgi:hypothetical protein
LALRYSAFVLIYVDPRSRLPDAVMHTPLRLNGVFALSLLVERTDNFAQVIDAVVRGICGEGLSDSTRSVP